VKENILIKHGVLFLILTVAITVISGCQTKESDKRYIKTKMFGTESKKTSALLEISKCEDSRLTTSKWLGEITKLNIEKTLFFSIPRYGAD